jgi:ABC-type phosphate/phosphonate transport system substrate-binding protein
VSSLIANARMYAVAPEAEAAWRELIAHVTAEAGIALDYLPYPAPQPLEQLWGRPDLGAVQMCGYPIAMRLSEVTPLAAPIPAAAWAGGRAVYRSDLIVKADSPYRALEDTFGGRAGWTVEHSHSGFNAFRHHLLGYRTPARPLLYREVLVNLITARRILDAVIAGDIDVGPLDAFWHMLIRKYRPELTAGVRVIESTELAPMPAFVASSSMEPESVAKLKQAFAQARNRPWFPPLAQALLIEGFVAVDQSDFATTLAWDSEAHAANYPFPA